MADDLIDADEASALLEVERARIDVMVAEGMLHPVGTTDPPRFSRAEVLALRELGG
jgi:hypothetical protein